MQDKIHLGITTPTPSSFSESVAGKYCKARFLLYMGHYSGILSIRNVGFNLNRCYEGRIPESIFNILNHNVIKSVIPTIKLCSNSLLPEKQLG